MKEHQKNYISYASVAVIKYLDRTNLRRLGFFFLVCGSRGTDRNRRQ